MMTMMNFVFYLSAAIAVFSTIMVISIQNAIHALLYLVVSLFSVAVIFFTLGAPFVGALEVIVYAGAIMVLFVFVVMLLNIAPGDDELRNPVPKKEFWIGPIALASVLLAEMIYIFKYSVSHSSPALRAISPKEIGVQLFTQYHLGVEMASMVLLAGLIGAYHIGRKVDEINLGKK